MSKKCNLCGDQGLLPSENGVTPCVCLQEYHLAKATTASNIPVRYLEASLERMHPTLKANLPKFWLDVVEAGKVNAETSKDSNGFIISGTLPVGKSCAVGMYVKQIIKVIVNWNLSNPTKPQKGSPVLWLNWESTYEWFQQNAINSDELNKRHNLYQDTKILVIDDLGAERAKLDSFGNAQLARIINGRYDSHKATIITTQLTKDELTERYGARLATRIIDDIPFVNA
jgi:DNA replication protein DnaC